MRLCVLLLTISFVLADDYDDHKHDPCHEEKTTVTQKKDHETHINSSLSKIECLIYNVNLLSCSWRPDSLPEDAQYSASFQQWEVIEDQPLNCSKKLGECKGLIQSDAEEITVKVNISMNGFWYIICQKYVQAEIEKLDPPQKITVLVNSTNFVIQWLQPRSCCSTEKKCFIYELMIDNELIHLKGVLAHREINIDPTRSYTTQIRTKLDKACASTVHWSDWSEAVVVGPSENVFKLSAGVITSIVLVLPMILLAFLLVCKFQRLFEKLFPSIPNPSKNVQMLLEKNDFHQVTPPKQSEEGDEIVEVIG